MDFSYGLDNIVSNLGIDGVSGCHIEIFSNKKIIAEGCYGIIEYNENLVRLNLSRGEVHIFGNNLEIYNMENKSITVKGNISSIEFSGVSL